MTVYKSLEWKNKIKFYLRFFSLKVGKQEQVTMNVGFRDVQKNCIDFHWLFLNPYLKKNKQKITQCHFLHALIFQIF